MEKLQLTKRDLVFVAGSGVLLLALEKVTSGLGLALGFMLGLAALLVTYRRLDAQAKKIKIENRKAQQKDFRQVESLFSLFFALKPNRPLPATRGWAGSPDFLKTIAENIFDRKPALVVEASSGVSTLVSAYCLKNLGHGRVISLEHEAEYAAATSSLLAAHGLKDIAEVIHAPLKTHDIDGQSWLWYDIPPILQPIDILIVDGPPSHTQPLARYPALPLLLDRLAENGLVLMDDADRPDEREIIERWATAFGMKAKFLPCEKGACVLERRQSKRPFSIREGALSIS